MEHVFPTYARFPFDLVKGEDVYLTDNHNKKYLDFTSGIGVCSFGYSNEIIQKNLEEQLGQVWHISNLYENQLQDDVAGMLCETDQLAFFCNSGTEANEAAFKLARKYTGKTAILAFNNGFHGRTYGSMSLTGNPDIQQGFAPLVPDVEFADYNDTKALGLIDSHLAAVILEVIQGEGGVYVADKQWLTDIQQACHDNGVLLIIDEVQTGIGRTGQKFAFQNFGLKPDIITLAKALGNGVPIGAMIGDKKLASAFGPGAHGTTFGGNKLAMAAAKGVLQQLTPAFLENIQDKADAVWQKLNSEIKILPSVTDVTGLGLMIGIHLNEQIDVNDVIVKLQSKGLLTLSAKHNTLRLLPPLIMDQAKLMEGLDIIKDSL
ncbi:acetylornithine transaminase [Companilactobacillus nantensis]|uniref:Acetylornithine aminotransferase n=1 Tax=Companilactobacillus nantensis DSM 16982 TaxID=1423774 RepID=A0A0R1WG36_9LACO|nr:acetylornithine transaminase [Companilactobacillus nantensis]KRM16840.1 acetylornithine aminotransferase [Companilactobacillus nantensis DSM 16982]GEO64282.1 acetylornithine aminotransferase [Companilactobacillus nantensis]